MNDLITAATSGLFVEVGKVIEHMKVQQARIADLERQLAEASAPAVEPPIGHISKGMLEQLRERLGVSGYVQSGRTEEFPVALYTAPLAADTDKVREAILSILPNPPASLDKHESASYCVDFRAGLKAAAELVGSMAAQAPVREVPGWQPIETAPKDKPIWAFNGEQGVMHWTEGDTWALWVWTDELVSDADPNPDQPTHYMPLPAAPVQPDTDKEQA